MEGLDANGSGTFVMPRILRRLVRSISNFSLLRLIGSKKALAILALGLGFPAGIGWAGKNETATDYIGSLSTLAGFKIEHLVVRGGPNVDREALRFMLSGELDKSILEFDAARTRELLKQNTRIESATVRKVYPDTVSIDIVEREPFAIWKSGDEIKLIGADGAIIGDAGETPPPLPQVVGDGAEAASAEFLSQMASYPMLAARVQAYVRVAGRRWDLVLQDGTKVLLPEHDWQGKLQELYELQTHEEILDREIVQIDMRLNDRLVLRLKPGQGEVRRTVIEKQFKNAGQST